MWKDRQFLIPPKIARENLDGLPYMVTIDPLLAGKVLVKAGVPSVYVPKYKIVLDGEDSEHYGEYRPSTKTVTIFPDLHWYHYTYAVSAAKTLVDEVGPKSLGKAENGPLIKRVFSSPYDSLSEKGRKDLSLLVDLTKYFVPKGYHEDFRNWLTRPDDLEGARVLLLAGANQNLRDTVAHELAHAGRDYIDMDPLRRTLTRVRDEVEDVLCFINDQFKYEMIAGDRNPLAEVDPEHRAHERFALRIATNPKWDKLATILPVA